MSESVRRGIISCNQGCDRKEHWWSYKNLRSYLLLIWSESSAPRAPIKGQSDWTMRSGWCPSTVYRLVGCFTSSDKTEVLETELALFYQWTVWYLVGWMEVKCMTRTFDDVCILYHYVGENRITKYRCRQLVRWLAGVVTVCCGTTILRLCRSVGLWLRLRDSDCWNLSEITSSRMRVIDLL